jgi:ribosome biogenesis GTPase
MTINDFSLPDLGWSAHFLGQLSLDEIERLTPVRLIYVARDRDRARGLGAAGEVTVTYPPRLSAGETTVGDWVLADSATGRIDRVLDRKSVLSRKAAGPTAKPQLIAANLDTLFIVTSCNPDFSIPRLERYLALALEAGVLPVVVLTKADSADDPDRYVAEARRVSPRIAEVIALNALDDSALDRLRPWIGQAETAAFVGSSGVGKSTLIAGLTGTALATQEIREDDAKGRHTTTGRLLLPVRGGGWVIDTPGMRELALSDAADGIDEVFDDIAGLAAVCRFRDCTHETEPGCAVRDAVDPARLARWRKLRREDARNSESVHERRDREKGFGRMVREVKDRKRQDRGE